MPCQDARGIMTIHPETGRGWLPRDAYTGVVEPLIDQQDGFVTHVCPTSTHGGQQFNKDSIGGPDDVGIRERLAKSRHTGMHGSRRYSRAIQ
jgi:hypothetical protein